MKVWAHTLVKNEAKWLWYSVTSVIDHVDKVLLWDTGSTDESLEIEKELLEKYPDKIIFKERKINTKEDFTEVRQEMLEETTSDWFIVLDGDEIWFEDSIKEVVKTINNESKDIESIVVPTVNLVGDIFHYQDSSSGRYKFGGRVGHYNLRAVKRTIPGLHSQGAHGVWGWADANRKMIQERNTFKFIDAPYLHTTNLRRSTSDKNVLKRARKYKSELGHEFPKDFYFPEAFFRFHPGTIDSPWQVMSPGFKLGAFFETPVRRLKRKLWQGSPGY